MVDPETISNSALLDMFYNMRYREYLAIISKFKKPNLPPMWNGLLTLIFKSFSERVTRSDSSNKLFLTIMYGVYSGVNMDYGSILWAQLVQSTIFVTRHIGDLMCSIFVHCCSQEQKTSVVHFEKQTFETFHIVPTQYFG